MNINTSDPKNPASACIIWLHGLGADAEDMRGLAEQLNILPPVRHVFMNAPIRPVTLNNNIPMRAWYDITGLNLTDREDKPGILHAETLINDVIAKQIEEGFTSKQIMLAGFSQGGAMALFAGLRYKEPLAGIIALSAYIPLQQEKRIVQGSSLPIFVAQGQYDDIVLPKWSQQTVDWLQSSGMNHIETHVYPMAHAVCLDELNDLGHWVTRQLSDNPESAGGKK